MENEVDCVSILSLPSELLFMILKYNNDCEIMNFAQTCKHFYAVINSNQFMWKQKSKELLPCDTYNLAEIYRDDSWCRIFKSFYWVQKQVYSELIAMSSKYFSRIDNLTLEDVRIFFSIGLSDKLNYYYVIHVLQELIRETHRAADNYHCTVPRTLTEAHYARSVVRFLMQTFLTVKWVEKYLKNVLYPEVVLNFFIQWLDPLRFHPDDEVDDTIKGLVDQVNAFLPKRNTSEPMTVQDKIDSGLVTEMHVLYAIKQVVYKQRGLSVVNKATLDTLDVVQVVRSGVGCAISLAAVVHGVARRCGVRCELLAFPHHLILQWQHAGEGSGVSYKIMLNNGELVPKGKCPFSDELGPSTYKYCAGSFLQYATASFLMSKGLPKDSYSQSSTNLLDFLSSTQSKDSPYWSFLPYLFDDVHTRALTSHRADLRVIQAPHKELIGALIRLGPRTATICRDYDVQRRTAGVRYAVGMICNHRKYDYLCVIREWSPTYPEKQGFPECKNLRAGTQQPFYNVVAVDQTHRLVAQEDIVHHAAPQRLVHLEDMIAKEFSHFDGFCYVPNSEKEREYPEDGPVRELYRARRAPR